MELESLDLQKAFMKVQRRRLLHQILIENNGKTRNLVNVFIDALLFNLV